MTRAELVAWLGRGLTPRPEWILPTDCDGEPAYWWRASIRGVSWRDFEREPCVCRGGFNVVECVGGFRMERRARCNAQPVADQRSWEEFELARVVAA